MDNIAKTIKYQYYIIDLICLLLIISICSASEEESELHEHLLGIGQYNVNVRPVKDVNKPVVVQLWFQIAQIYDVSEPEQLLNSHVHMGQNWHDEYLQWNPADYGGLNFTVVRAANIWTPDIVIENSMQGTEKRVDTFLTGEDGETVVIMHNGIVHRRPSYFINSQCHFHTQYFPFDRHDCWYYINSNAYGHDQVQIEMQKFKLADEFRQLHPEWKASLLISYFDIVKYSYTGMQLDFDTVSVVLFIVRKHWFCTINITIPSVILMFLTAIMFILPVDCGERMGLGITVLLAFTVFSLVVTEHVPHAATGIPLIIKFLTLAMACVYLCLAWTAVVIRLWQHSPRKQYTPRCCGRVLLKIRKFVFVRRLDAICNCVNERWSALKTDDDTQVEETEFLEKTKKENDIDQNSQVKLDIICYWHTIIEVLDRLVFILIFTIQLIAFFTMVIIQPMKDAYESEKWEQSFINGSNDRDVIDVIRMDNQ